MLPFTKVKNINFQKLQYYLINKLYQVKDCENNSVVLDKKNDVTLQQYIN